jgi:flagellar biosynthesis component FlhA
VKEQAEMFGYTVVDPPSVVSTHITEVIKSYAHELIGRQETKQLIDHTKETYPILIEEVTPNPLSVGDVQHVLAKLLKESVSIRNLPIIFEVLADYGKMMSGKVSQDKLPVNTRCKKVCFEFLPFQGKWRKRWLKLFNKQSTAIIYH